MLLPEIQMTDDEPEMPTGRTISDDDARAIAKALFAEATRQILMATGRGVWSTLKVAAFPLLMALIIWWLTMQGRLALPNHGSGGIH
jgi:hypothetical protein